MHDEGHVSLALRSQHTRRRKSRVIYQNRVVVADPLDRVRRIADDDLKWLVVPMLRADKRVLVGDIELVKADVMQKHIDAAEVVCGEVDLLPEKALTNVFFSEYFCDLQKQRTGTAGRVYKNAVFDTNRKSLLRHISAEKGLK